MKKLLVLGALLTLNAFGAERILINDSKQMDAELNVSTVRCSAIGYGGSELKVSLKGLDGWTLFDHSNINKGDLSGQPCMTAGLCKMFPGQKVALSISDILAGGDRTETVVVRRQIVEVKEVTKDAKNKDVCSRHIEERLATEVTKADGTGKIKFNHLRFGIEETFPLSVCQ